MLLPCLYSRSSPPSPVRRGRGGQRRGQGRGGFVTIGNQGGGAGFSPRGGQGRGGRRKNFLKRLPVNNNDSDPVLAAQIKVGWLWSYLNLDYLKLTMSFVVHI